MENAACYAPQILVSTEGLPREQWLEYRRKGIGGSDAAAVLGISPFRTGRDLYYDKLNKGFEPDLSCRGYRFVMGKNVTPEANCASNGFHCAEDPLDCLSYYSDMDRSIYCLVQPGGDIDEDDRDSKIACTELTILRQLTRKEFFLHALAYMVDHPCRKVSGKVQREHGVSRGGYAIVRGKEPAACGKLGDILAFAREQRETEEICQIAVAEVDGEKIQPGVWYDINFAKREAVQK